ncbi:hypothetical protein [Flavobacterium sp.]|uniref:hypothetical protein n=2 Tax=Flavobacterium sp. TaxID=239 RepID=UPI0040487B8B
MKHLKLTLFSLIALFVSATMLVSCSEDNETTTNETTNKNVDSFLKSFYSKDYTLGLSAKVNPNSQISALARTASLEEVELTEVFVDNETKARGYIITDKNTGEFLYFIDVDRDSFTLTSLDVKNSDQKTFNNIDDIYDYFSTDEFDFIEIALNETNSTSTADRRFWGWQSHPGPCDHSTGQSTLMETYYVVGIGVKTRKVVGLDGGDVIQPCAGGALLDD